MNYKSIKEKIATIIPETPIVGIILGILIGNITSILIDSAFVIPWVWLGAGILLCLFVGLISGIYPAIKASRMNTVRALKYD